MPGANPTGSYIDDSGTVFDAFRHIKLCLRKRLFKTEYNKEKISPEPQAYWVCTSRIPVMFLTQLDDGFTRKGYAAFLSAKALRTAQSTASYLSEEFGD